MTTQAASRPLSAISKSLPFLPKSPKVTDITRLDECFKSSSFLRDSVSDPKTGHSEEPVDAPVSRAFSKRLSYVDLLLEPDQTFMSRRINVAMRGFKTLISDDFMLAGNSLAVMSRTS